VSLPDEVQAVAAALREGLQGVLGDGLAGLFVYGAALFPHPDAWMLDFDFHALVQHPIATAECERVRAVYAALATQAELGRDLDGYFVLLTDATKPEPPVHQLDHSVRDEAWALHRAHVHAGRYASICGVDPQVIVPVPTWPELQAGLRSELAFIECHPAATAFGVLNGARILASYDRRDVVLSKYEAAQWALDTLPSDWHDLVRAAVRTYERAPRALDDAALRDGWAGFVALVCAEIPAR
jgi:Aminoglycoside adenylyltransferase, C-terminal domain